MVEGVGVKSLEDECETGIWGHQFDQELQYQQLSIPAELYKYSRIL